MDEDGTKESLGVSSAILTALKTVIEMMIMMMMMIIII